MTQSKKHKKIKYEGYEFLDIDTLDYLSQQLMYCSDTYAIGDIVILKYNKKGYDELLYYVNKLLGHNL